jgi:hypothetical protein
MTFKVRGIFFLPTNGKLRLELGNYNMKHYLFIIANNSDERAE